MPPGWLLWIRRPNIYRAIQNIAITIGSFASAGTPSSEAAESRQLIAEVLAFPQPNNERLRRRDCRVENASVTVMTRRLKVVDADPGHDADFYEFECFRALAEGLPFN